jgi:hypothetical protein
MRKLIAIAVSFTAIASLVVPALASADVARYQSETATFTMVQPAGVFGQFDNVWTHNYTVKVNPCDSTFSGTGVETGSDQNGPATHNETVTGSFNADGSISLDNTRDDGVVWSLDNVKTDNSTVTLATLIAPAIPSNLEFRATAPVITNTSSFKNHGAYVSSQGGGSDAAHSCIGMPINSSK